MNSVIRAAAAAFIAVAAYSPAQALVVGTADGSNSIPFDTYLGGYYYQQIYSSSLFGAGLNITDLSFYRASGNAQPGTGNFRIFLSTTNEAIPTFDTTNIPYGNLASYTKVFEGTLSAITDGKLNILLDTAFNYSSAAGSLLLTIVNLDLSGNGDLFLDTDKNPNINSRFSNYPYDTNGGLVTGFNEGPNNAPGETPVPAVGAGIPLLIGAGALIRRFRRRKAA